MEKQSVFGPDRMEVCSSPAQALLLRCASAHADGKSSTAASAFVSKDVDWMAVLRLASRHHVTPLLYQNLRHLNSSELPEEIRQYLRDYFQSTVVRNLQLTNELLRILALFSDAGIRAIPYKGPVLAHVAYGNLALRQFADLDLLVDEGRVLAANDLLRASGYLLDDQWSGLDERRYLRSGCEFTWIRADGRVSVEVHWRVVPRFFGDTVTYASLAARAVQVQIGGQTVSSFAPEDLLLILCIHPLKHTWDQLNWIVDVAALVQSHPCLDWEQVMTRAEQAGIRRAVCIGLTLSAELLGLTLPLEVRRRIRADARGTALAAALARRLFDDGDRGAVDTWKVWMLARERRADRQRLYRYLPYVLVTPSVKDRSVLSLPERLAALYYLIRPVRAAVEFGQKRVRPRDVRDLS